MQEHKKNDFSVVQICHGPLIPEYSSAYSLRCHSVIRNLKRTLISCGGAIFRDAKSGNSEQYRSLILTGLSLFLGNRSLEIYISRGKYVRRKYLRRLYELVRSSEVIIFEGPWQYPLVRDKIKDKLVVYDAHNVEYNLRDGNVYQDECKKVEGDLLQRADIVFSVTKKDMKSFIDIYHVEEKKLYFTPHLIDIASAGWKGSDSNCIVFIGSVYSPNNSALDRIYDLAQKYPKYKFEIIGSVRSTRRHKPKNLIYHGTVDGPTKDEIMSRCFLALNPVTEGSGRNVKMIDYLAHGLPILSTPVGIRGLEGFDISSSVVVSHPDKFGENIDKLAADREGLKKMSTNARELYENILKAEGSIDPEEIILKKYEVKR
ncbi:MAG: glycosyltransferase [Cuniculiplasma divulgatum]|nr:MAG: glycosyltransferase [Cuniculiplasma divulgatum]